MCLDKQVKFEVKATHTDGSVKGWKVFKVRRNKLCGEQFGGNKQHGWNRRRTSKTVLLRDNIRDNKGVVYEVGFHVLLSNRGLKKFVNAWLAKNALEVAKIVPVYFMPDEIVATGLQKGCKCVVVKLIWIEPDDYDKVVGKEK